MKKIKQLIIFLTLLVINFGLVTQTVRANCPDNPKCIKFGHEVLGDPPCDGQGWEVCKECVEREKCEPDDPPVKEDYSTCNSFFKECRTYTCTGKGCSDSYGCNEETCFPEPPDVDCQVGSWSGWGACSATCGGGTQSRTRTVTVWPENDGNACPDLTETRSCNTQACVHTLTVSKISSNNGGGTVRSTPAGINYGPTSSYNFTAGTNVTLSATNGTGIFRGWSGDGTNNGNNRNVSMTEDRSVMATFNRPVMTVNISPAGGGSVTSGAGAYNLGASASPRVSVNAPGFRFHNWTGACTSTSQAGCTVLMNDDKTATANFIQRFSLSLTKAASGTVNGTGTVTSTAVNPARSGDTVNCGLDCTGTQSYHFDTSTAVTLSATNNGTGLFRRWTGSCTGAGTCGLTMSAARSVTAVFERPLLRFNLTRPSNVRDASGQYAQYPHQDINGLQRDTRYDRGTNTTIDAAKTTVGYRFNGWVSSSPCSGMTAVCSLLMDRDRTVTASYITLPTTTTLTYARIPSGAPVPSVTYGSRPRLNWGSTNATNCHGVLGGIQTGSRPNPSGSWTPASGLTQHTTYRVECYGPHPTGSFAEVQVVVRAPEAEIGTFEIDPVWVRRGNSTRLTWNVQNPNLSGVNTSCEITRDRVPIAGGSRILNAANQVWSGGADITDIQGVTELAISCQGERPADNGLIDSDIVSRHLTVFVLPIYNEF